MTAEEIKAAIFKIETTAELTDIYKTLKTAYKILVQKEQFTKKGGGK